MIVWISVVKSKQNRIHKQIKKERKNISEYHKQRFHLRENCIVHNDNIASEFHLVLVNKRKHSHNISHDRIEFVPISDRFSTQWVFILTNVILFIYVINWMLTNLSNNAYRCSLSLSLALYLLLIHSPFVSLSLSSSFHLSRSFPFSCSLNGKKCMLLNELRAYS